MDASDHELAVRFGLMCAALLFGVFYGYHMLPPKRDAEHDSLIRAEVEAGCDSLRYSDSLRIMTGIDSLFQARVGRKPAR